MASKKTTAVTKVSDVPNMLEVINAKMAKIKNIEETIYKTTGDLSEYGFSSIKEEMKIENLIRAYSKIKGKSEMYENAAKDLKIKTFPQFNITGGTVENWKHDIQLRIAILTQEEEKKKLNKWKDKLSEFVTKEQQLEMTLEEMKKDLR
jgi:hypothetical protein